ncbi:MAG: hypothetical protein ACM3PD_03790 [Chloroflexota bacterium]
MRLLMAAPFYIGAAIYLGRGAARLSRRDRVEIAFFGLTGYYAANLLDFVGLARISVVWSVSFSTKYYSLYPRRSRHLGSSNERARI